MQLPSAVPVMTLPNVILFPQAMLPLHIFEPRYRRMLADSLHSHRMFAVAMQKPGRTRETPAAVAGLGLIRASVTNKDGTSNLVLQGIARVELTRRIPRQPYRVHGIRCLPQPPPPTVAMTALTEKLLELVTRRLKQGIDLPFKTLGELAPADLQSTPEPGGDAATSEAFREVLKHLHHLDDPEQLADLVSATLLSSATQRQAILETPGIEDRLRKLVSFLLHDLERPNANGIHE